MAMLGQPVTCRKRYEHARFNREKNRGLTQARFLAHDNLKALWNSGLGREKPRQETARRLGRKDSADDSVGATVPRAPSDLPTIALEAQWEVYTNEA